MQTWVKWAIAVALVVVLFASVGLSFFTGYALGSWRTGQGVGARIGAPAGFTCPMGGSMWGNGARPAPAPSGNQAPGSPAPQEAPEGSSSCH